MTVLAILEVSPMIADGTSPPFAVDATVTSDGQSYESVLEVDATVEGVVDGVRPRGVPQIVLPFKITYDGTELPSWKRLPGMTVTETVDGPTFSFDMPLRGDFPSAFSEPMGTTSAFLGPPGGLKTLDIDARFVEGGQVRTVRLVTNGMTENSTAKVGSADVRTINGIGARGRYDQALATYTLSPGHGLARNSVVRNVLLDASIPSAAIALGGGGRRCYKGVQLVDRGALDFANEYLEPAIQQLGENRDGQFVVVPLAPTGSEIPQFTFREQDLLRAEEVGESTAADGPTCVRVTGTKQITRDDAGLRTEIKVVETYGNIPPRQALWQQASDGSLTAQGTISYPADQLFLLSRVTYEQEFQGDTLVSERVTTESRYNPQAWRYSLDVDGLIDFYQSSVYLYDAGAVTDDGSAAFIFRSERFGMTSQVTTRYLFDDRGLQVSQITETSRYLLRYRSLKSRASLALVWETDVDYNANVLILASGDAVVANESFWGPPVVLGAQAFAGTGISGGMTWPLYGPTGGFFSTPADRDTVAYQVSDDGFILRETSTKDTYTASSGATELYQTGEFGDASWTFQTAEMVVTTYMASVDGTHSIITASTDIQGNAKTTVEYGQGYLPAAERSLDMIDPAWAATFGSDDLQYTRAASLFESQPIKVQVCSDALALVRPRREELVSSEWAEDTDELTDVAVYRLRLGCVAELQFGLPFNPLVRPATMVHLSLPTVGWEKNVWVTSVQHTEGARDLLTVVSGEEWLL